MKTCPRCKIAKPVDEFGRRKDGGFNGYCRPCEKAKNAERPRKPRDRVNKICPICKVLKPRTEFPKTKFGSMGTGSYCFPCDSAFKATDHIKHKEKRHKSNRSRRATFTNRNRKIIHEHLLANPCVRCGLTDIMVLEFDHLGSKLFGVAADADWAAEEKIRAEIAKCQVLCGNCHFWKTLQQKNAGPFRPPIEELSLKGKRLSGYLWRRARYDKLKDFVRGKACVDCGLNDLWLLQFDHVGPKRGSVCKMIYSHSWEDVLVEISNCVLRCVNCHKRRTYKQRGYRSRETASREVSPPKS